MNYQAPLALEQSLLSLKDEYLEITKVDIKAPAPTKTGIFFGWKDTDTRMYQINLLEAIAKTKNPTNASNKRDTYFEKFQLMVAACYLIKQQIIEVNKVAPVYSELNQLIDNALNTSDNKLDRHTIKECLHIFINCSKQQINQTLRNNQQPEISETNWQELKSFATKLINNQKTHDDSPIADPLSYGSGQVFHVVGWGLGFTLGQTLGKAGQSALIKNTLTAGLTSSLILLGPLTGSSAAAATFFARPHAEQAVEYAAGYGAAQLCGYTFKKIGQGTGWVVGKSMELAIDAGAELGSKAYSFINSGEVVELDIKVGLDLVNKELTAKSRTLSHADFMAKIQEVLTEQESAIKQTPKETKAPKPKTLSFAISAKEKALLPNIIDILGYKPESEEEEFLVAKTDLETLSPAF